MQNGTRLAAVDMGSNSFRLEIGVLDHGQIQRTEYLKETVRLGGGLDTERLLSADAMERGWECLARFAERLAGFQKRQVRAVATQTLREAKNRQQFVKRAQEILGFPIDVIPGREEARLIYQGVARLLPQSDERRLVIDIGGRSTEVIVGQHHQPTQMESFRVGSVNWSMKYFGNGVFTPRSFQVADIAAKAVLDEAVAIYPRDRWDTAYGSSGTVGAICDTLLAAGRGDGTITREGLDWLRDRLIKAQRADNLRLEGIRDDRRPIIGGGLAVLRALFDIQQMLPAQGALRQGVLYDLIDRESDATDMRSATVDRLKDQFGIDLKQSARVAAAALALFAPMLPADLDAATRERIERKLEWAAELHEIGTLISHSAYHKHGAYVLRNTDAPGFAVPELERLGQLVLGHRGKLTKPEFDFSDTLFVQGLISLRIAVILCHARRDPDLHDIALSCRNKASGRRFTLSCPSGWARTWPQSAHLLREEALLWQRTPWSLVLQGLD